MRSYRTISFVFLGGPLAVLVLLALANLATSGAVRDGSRSWWDPGVAFSADGLASLLSRALYPAGISIDPGGAVIGRDGWLFLGDRYEGGVTAVRVAPTRAQSRAVERVAEGALAWRDWLKQQGVGQFWILVAPDKDDVYPDYLPAWVGRVPGNRQDAMRSAFDSSILIDAGQALRTERLVQSELLFRRTDTHWSNLGAWFAADAFFRRSSAADPGLQFPTAMELGQSWPTPGSDLAQFLRLEGVLVDEHQHVTPIGAPVPQTQQVEYDIGDVVLPSRQKPQLMTTPNALNQRRVLWLHDSFGWAMAPYMHAAFTEVLDVHVLSRADVVGELVNRFKPDIVLISVVDRQADLRWLRSGPPD
ncbi:MAG: hypothetical protein BGO81_17160 [Devosia sp. 66-22]|nr:MAG: hypothetical protein BGO81_17160 [Devosia sp. 66-22]